MSPEQVREIVELLYHRSALLSEKLAWRVRDQHQPYPAEFVRIDGAICKAWIICGHNPHLHARRVKNLIVMTDTYGRDTGVSWTEERTVREISEEIRRIHPHGF